MPHFFDGEIQRNAGYRYSKRAGKSSSGGTTPPPPPRDYSNHSGFRDRAHSGGPLGREIPREQRDDANVEDFERRRQYVSTLLERYYSHPSNRYHSMPSSLRKQLADTLAGDKQGGDGGNIQDGDGNYGGYGDDSISEVSSFAIRSARTTPEPSFYDDEDGASSMFAGNGRSGRRKSKSRFFRSSSIRSLKKLVNKLRGGGRDGSHSRAPRPATDPGFLASASRDSGLETPSDSSVNYNTNNLQIRSHSPVNDHRAFVRPKPSTTTREISTPALCGIANHGNTCYINAVLQCLSNTDLLSEYFLTGRYLVDLSNNLRNADRYGSHGNVTMALAEFFKALWFNSYKPDVSLSFKRVVEHYSEQYRGNQQQDAQEFFYWLSDRVHEDLNVAVKRRYKLHKSRSKNEDELAAAAMEKHLEAHNSFISARFHGLFLSSITCPVCYKQSTKPDPFMCISLPVSQSTKRPLYVVIVFLNRQPRQVRFGLNADVTATFREVKQCLGDATGVTAENIVLCEIDDKGIRNRLLDHSEIVTLGTKCIWALEIPGSSRANADEELVLLVGNLMDGKSGTQRFGGISTLKVHREVSYGDLCRSILLSLKPQLKSSVFVQDIPLNSFRIRIVNDYRPLVYVPHDVALPLYTQVVDNALAKLGSGARTPLLKVMLEWKRESRESYFSSTEERILDHVSAQDLRDQEENPEVQGLRDCLTEYTTPESCQWYCPNCRRRQDEAIKRIVLYWLPDILVLHLKRFKQQSNGQLVKLDSTVWFPVNELDLSDFMYESRTNSQKSGRRTPVTSSYRAPSGDLYVDMGQNQNVYDLYAVCNHSGYSPNSGHYTAYCRNPVNGRWYCFDDQSVTAMHERDLVTNSAYLLFYERRQARRGNSSQHSSTESGFVDHWYFQLCAQQSAPSKDNMENLDGQTGAGMNGCMSACSQRRATAGGQYDPADSGTSPALPQSKLFVKLPEKGQQKQCPTSQNSGRSIRMDCEKHEPKEIHQPSRTAQARRNGPSADTTTPSGIHAARGASIQPTVNGNQPNSESKHKSESKRASVEPSGDGDGKAPNSSSYPDFSSVLLPSCAKLLTTGIIPAGLSGPASSASSKLSSVLDSSQSDHGGHKLPQQRLRTCSVVETDL